MAVLNFGPGEIVIESSDMGSLLPRRGWPF
jgi:hypothetical protein